MAQLHVQQKMSVEEKLRLFDELIVVAGQLATTADNFAVTLSAEFEQGVRNQVDNCRAVLNKCPAPADSTWDGSLRDEDLLIEVYQTEPMRNQNIGKEAVKITHSITGLKRASETRPTRAENEKIARKSLADAVRRRYSEMQQRGQV